MAETKRAEPGAPPRYRKKWFLSTKWRLNHSARTAHDG